MSKKIQEEMEVKFTKKDIESTLEEVQDAMHKRDYDRVKEIMKNYGLSEKMYIDDIAFLREVVKTLNSEVEEITKERLLQMKEEQDFEEFKKKMRLHKLYLEKDPLGVRADIRGLILRGRVLTEYDFTSAQIRDTDFSYCDLRDVDFSYTYFDNVNFTNAFLERANFSGSALYNVDFTDANLTYANLPKHSCYLYLNENKNKKKFKDSYKRRVGICLEKPIIGWKKCHLGNVLYHEVLVKLEIPRGAVVFSINDDKCRTNMAKVLDIVSLNGKKHYRLAYAGYTLTFKYRVGEEIFEPNFNCQYNVECAEGIHFFRNKRRAIEY